MQCHATGDGPTRQYPRKNFVQLMTPLGILWFRDRETCKKWVDSLPEETKKILEDHNYKQTPGAIFFE